MMLKNKSLVNIKSLGDKLQEYSQIQFKSGSAKFVP
jgi:hypothetical protein